MDEVLRSDSRLGTCIAIVQMGVNIGDRAIIGALSLVNKDVPERARAYGSPARVLTDRSVPE